jgi:hypothetical protein
VKPERMARLVARWARLYTRRLPADVAQRRIDEIDADLYDHIAHEREQGTRERRIAVSILARMIRGLPADASWRRQKSGSIAVGRVAGVTVLILLVPAAANVFSDGGNWGLGDFVLAALLVGGSGLLLELAVKKPRNVALQVLAAAIGGAAIVFGEWDDAPGLVLFGGLLILGTLALAVRTARRTE